MAKVRTQYDILSKNDMGEGTLSIQTVGVDSTNLDDIKFEALYSEEVNFLENQEVLTNRTTQGRVVTKVGLERNS